MRYAGYCINLHDSGNAEAWREMLKAAKKIGIRAFQKSCSLAGFQKGTLASVRAFISDDSTSAFFTSTLKGKPCVFLQTKGFEFIWTPSGQLPPQTQKSKP